MMEHTILLTALKGTPVAAAKVSGSKDYPKINGTVLFYPSKHGVLVVAQVFGLPKTAAQYPTPIFGFHIHSGGSCSGNESDPFADALTHYNPQNRPHPYHAGDLPPLFGNNGYAFSAFVTNRFTIKEVLGKTVIIHSAPDDFVSQPAGNAGTKIACGTIQPYGR